MPQTRQVRTTERRKKRIAKVDGGIMPAEIMLQVARFWYGRFAKEANKTAGQDPEKLKDYAIQARGAASDAAPYFHPRLATLQSNVNLTGRLTLEALVSESLKLAEAAANDAVPEMIDVTPKDAAE